GWGSGGALYQPLAAGIIGGSVSALLVTFFLLPTAYAVLERWQEQRRTSPPRGAAVAVAQGRPSGTEAVG
ncbi:MAG: hypothetical protein RLZ32_1512, partial [Gemmatimonadota bacterium]